MPFNLQTFKTRALTAIIFVMVMLAGLLINKWTFLALFTIIHFGCWVEYQKIIAAIDEKYKHINTIHKYAVMLAGWAFMLWMTNYVFNISNIDLHEISFWVMIAMLAITFFSAIFFSIKNLSYSLLGLIYISLSWGLMMNLRVTGSNAFLGDLGWIIPIILIASIWINDTMAYIVGSFIGKTPFSKISPKKTWEGTIGGAVLAVATITLVCYFGFGIQDYVSLIIISSIAAVVGTAGDLLESKLKRIAGLKDSGSIMPGHGGFLDRFDSLILATPFVWLYVHFFM
jgi:phosphatidate cytidylyltransferase